MTLKIAVLASTRGTDLQAIIDEIDEGRLDAELRVVVTSKECRAAERARKAGRKTVVLEHGTEGETRESYDRRLAALLEEEGVELVILVGWMRLLSPWFVTRYRHRIMNVHPSLLPSFPGMDRAVHEEVLAHGCKVSGCTIHFVDEGTDTGPIIMQGAVPVLDEDTPETLKARVQSLEKRLYPEAIRRYAAGGIEVRGRRVLVKDEAWREIR